MFGSSVRVRRALIGITVSAAVGAVALAGPAMASPVDGGAPAAVASRSHQPTQDALNGLVKAGMPGVAGEAQTANGKKWFGSAGYADTDTQRKRTAADHFRAGSITKTFMSTVLLQLEAEGRLDLDDSVEKWLPGVVKGNGYDASKISVRQMLNHTSGIHDSVETPEWQETMNGPGFLKHRFDVKKPEEIVAMALKYPAYFEPGDGWHYSNTNYVLAGMVIEKVTGDTYAHQAEKRIIKRLGLKHTSFPGTDTALPAPHPVGYSKLYAPNPGPEIYDATEYSPTWSGATGELISTSGDLNTYFRALNRGKLLPQQQMKEMYTTVETGQHYRYGLGLIARDLSCGVTVWGHDGIVWGSLTSSATTRDGAHSLTFQMNGDWLAEGAPYEKMFDAEFCSPGR
ncbi:serine hydrolase domain-containing protein [Streptomyces zagrosensis]|uniref:D-alanyl-D-alanine carboxypeptidase n=1 Tax=Streptomyces zagrosensis TaxID=1042984 RepID=A0A7W9UZF8_9ACTN|nr:serine hydrolase domain-containing protein [Streptomyces zagrosensis]MBB5935729.1 D-alanyl-D-alanine carboxypeptidase [Streptomyces zagrosensis]